jgi:hypothetical protein
MIRNSICLFDSCQVDYYLFTCIREKMVGANLYENNIEGAFELWVERKNSK